MRNIIVVITIICLAMAAITNIFAQEHENIEQVGRMYHYWDKAEYVTIIGDYAYVSAGIAGLQIFTRSHALRGNAYTALPHWSTVCTLYRT